MSLQYIALRIMMFFLVIWAAATINFMLPRMVPGDPISRILERYETQGETVQFNEDFIEQYRERFGLNDSIGVQYLRYVSSAIQFDFGYSVTFFPAEVGMVISNSLPWTILLLATTTIFAFFIGIILGALFAWQRTFTLLRLLTGFLIIIAPLPYYLVAIAILFFLGITLDWFPITSASLPARFTGANSSSIQALVEYSALPALSILLSAIGSWALSMRSMMVNVRGEDYITLAHAKGLSDRRILGSYAMRNAMLPLVTQFGISLATVVSGATLVEIIFQYPGIGTALLDAISNLDYPVIQAITYIIVVSVAFGVLIIDLIYPLLDPRISYEGH